MTTPEGRFDAELTAALAAWPRAQAVPTVASIRARLVAPEPDELLRDSGVLREDVVVEGEDGAALEISVLRRADSVSSATARPGIYNLHGGGMIVGTRFTGIGRVIDWVRRFDAIAVTIEYRLAPEFPHPFPLEDAYAGWQWMTRNAVRLGIDPERMLIAGASAGGGLAAGVCLAARDRGDELPAGQMLLAPMLDDRVQSSSALQFAEGGTWDRASNVVAWDALLGPRRGSTDVAVYEAPARAVDLRGLPPAYIDCGGAEIFRDECVAYAAALWAAGSASELHVWAGGFHSFDALAPTAAVSRAAVEARIGWIERTLRVSGSRRD